MTYAHSRTDPDGPAVRAIVTELIARGLAPLRYEPPAGESDGVIYFKDRHGRPVWVELDALGYHIATRRRGWFARFRPIRDAGSFTDFDRMAGRLACLLHA